MLLEVAGVGGVVGALGALQLEGDLVHGADVVVHALLLARPVVAERALVVTHLQDQSSLIIQFRAPHYLLLGQLQGSTDIL